MFRDKQPCVLAELLDRTLFEEPCKPGIGKFFDESRTKWVVIGPGQKFLTRVGSAIYGLG